MDSLLWWCRIEGTVILRIWWQVLVLVVYSAGVVAIHEHTEYKLGFNNSIIPVMGMVVSLLMGFRTNSAYSRYWDGRTIWSQMTKNIRALVLLIWTNVPGDEAADVIEKKSAINLCMAFAVATKHYLRDEFGYSMEDIKDLIFHLQKYYHIDGESGIENSRPNSTSPARASVSLEMTARSTKRGSTKSLPEDEVFLKMPTEGAEIVKSSQKSKKPKKEFKLMAYDYPTPSNIPLEILSHLLSYLNHIATKDKKAESFCISGMSAAIITLLETLTNFERVLRTPIPLAYSIHLHHCVWLFLLAVPFQFVALHSWATLVIVGIASFCMLGILSIAYEIEDPFGYDANDLPLEDYCKVLRREIELITGAAAPQTKDWVYSKRNMPFKYSGNDETKADDWALKTKEELRVMLQRNAKAHLNVDNMSRKHK